MIKSVIGHRAPVRHLDDDYDSESHEYVSGIGGGPKRVHLVAKRLKYRQYERLTSAAQIKPKALETDKQISNPSFGFGELKMHRVNSSKDYSNLTAQKPSVGA